MADPKDKPKSIDIDPLTGSPILPDVNKPLNNNSPDGKEVPASTKGFVSNDLPSDEPVKPHGFENFKPSTDTSDPIKSEHKSDVAGMKSDKKPIEIERVVVEKKVIVFEPSEFEILARIKEVLKNGGMDSQMQDRSIKDIALILGF